MISLDFLDSIVPQIPGGPWANHAFWGTVLGIVIAFLLILAGVSVCTAWCIAMAVVFMVCAIKKLGDYLNKGPAQGETALSCAGKTFVTALGTAIVWLVVLGIWGN